MIPSLVELFATELKRISLKQAAMVDEHRSLCSKLIQITKQTFVKLDYFSSIEAQLSEHETRINALDAQLQHLKSQIMDLQTASESLASALLLPEPSSTDAMYPGPFVEQLKL